jgi:hypothetical protein
VRAVHSIGAIAALCRRTPVDFAENLLDDPDAGLGPRQFERCLAIQHPQSLPEPFVGLFSIAENILGESLDPGQANQSIRFLDGERFLAFSPIATRARRNDKSLDLSV